MEIELCGYKVQIDEEDYERITSRRWGVRKSDLKRRGMVYFRTQYTESPGVCKEISLQRFILGLMPNDGMYGDHINGDTLDNRKCNLRKCTRTENIRNQKLSKRNKLGIKGVRLISKSGRYRAAIRYHGKDIHLGMFSTPEEAHEAYCVASKKYHGEFGRTE